jgi:hypothetical protein
MTNFNYNPNNSPFKPANKLRKGASLSGKEGTDYQKFLEFLEMSGNSQQVKKKIVQNISLDKKNKPL